MRAVDRATIAAGTPGEVLMERAGEGVAGALERSWGSPLALRVLVLSGGGNNGGDGFVAARLLASRGALGTGAGCAPRERLKGDALALLARLAGSPPRVRVPPGRAA